MANCSGAEIATKRWSVVFCLSLQRWEQGGRSVVPVQSPKERAPAAMFNEDEKAGWDYAGLGSVATHVPMARTNFFGSMGLLM